jgi:hypothetical protein
VSRRAQIVQSPSGASAFIKCNSHPLTGDHQGYVMQFTRLIASKAMTDSVVSANLKMLHDETEVAATPTRASTAPVRTPA